MNDSSAHLYRNGCYGGGRSGGGGRKRDGGGRISIRLIGVVLSATARQVDSVGLATPSETVA